MKTDSTWRACTLSAQWWGRPAWSVALLLGLLPLDGTRAAELATTLSTNKTIRVAAVQAQRRVIDFRLSQPADVLAHVDKNLIELERIVHQAGAQECDALAFPEDTLGLLNWTGVNEAAAKEVLPAAVKRMLDRLGRAAAAHRMYLVVCSDHLEADGGMYNTAFFLGRDGKEIGRYHKVCPTWSECGPRERGSSFPVFPTPDLSTVGMLICYDLVMPETARCLALAGADLIFFPTMGGAAIGDDDIGVQALRVRAVENFVWLIVAHRGSGAMIISPQGKIVARAEGPDGFAIADIDPFGGREGGDAMNHQRDMRARLFRERNPVAFGLLTDPNPPVLNKVPINLTSEEAGRIAARVLTVGEEEFKQADALARAGSRTEAISAFEKLRAEYRDSWIDRRAQERLATLREGIRGTTQPAAAKRSDAATKIEKVRLRVAGAQIPVSREVRKNVEAITRAIQFAAREKADVLVTPEGSLSGYTHEFDARATTQALEAVVRKAREMNVALVLGTCFAEADGSRYDAQRFYDRTGNYLGFHSKILLCRRVADPNAKGELDFFNSTPLRTFALQGLTVGGLICNDLWANPEWTPMDDPHLAQKLAAMDARVIFLSVNSGQAGGDELELNRGFHESNLRMRARSAKLWIVVADACDAQGQHASNCPSGVLGPDGRWAVQVDSRGEQFFVHTIEVERPGSEARAEAAAKLSERVGAVPARTAAGPPSAKPTAGIVAQYPGDTGIERDPRVLFAENFETGTLDDLAKRWSSVKGNAGPVLNFAEDAPPNSAGKRSLQITATLGENDGGHLYKQLARGVEKLHARFYVKFAEDAPYIHHFVHLGGYQPPTPWPQGGAGERPRGDERITVGIEPHGLYGSVPPPGAWNFYSYWHEMKVSADGRYWGNAISPETPLLVPRARWQCVEVMLKLNSAPDQTDGELALWLDGEKAMHIAKGTPRGPWSGMGFKLPKDGGTPFEGFHWRTSDELKLNFFWLLHYVTDLAPRQNKVTNPNRINRVWFDDIVVATEYVGPIRLE